MYISESGTEYVRRYGTRQMVWDEVVFETSGHLKKDDLIMKGSRIVSKRRSALGKERFAKKNPFLKCQDDEKESNDPDEISGKPSGEKRLPMPRLKKRRRKKQSKVV